MAANFKCLGVDPFFPPMKNMYVNNEGFRVAEEHGGPLVAKKLSEFQARDDDVFVLSFPKTGTTWLQEIVYLIASDLDFESAKNTHLFHRCPYLDNIGGRLHATSVEEMKSPRLFKLHVSYSSIPESALKKRCKIIYPFRNPKDTLISYYHFSKKNKIYGFTDDLPKFFDLFLEGKVLYGPYWKHCVEIWNRRHEDNVCLVTFEDMKKDLPSVIRKIGQFMGKSLDDAQVEAIAKHCSLDEMRKNPSTNPDYLPNAKQIFDMKENSAPVFLRKGEVGDWKNYFTDEMNKRMDEHIEKYFTPAGLKFVYEI